uniref:Uncharacterized protein n=1 Tax=Tanacetum cinerariifolium TaxID=118510 RepID=A0A6L2K3N4_TANCI|nr:hypothetical protein [Tanacetum cinerariifolium]
MSRLLYTYFTKLIIDYLLSLNKSIPRRPDSKLHSSQNDHLITKLLSINNDEYTFGMEVPDAMINDAIKKKAWYKYYMAKKVESEKDKIVEKPKEQHVSPITSRRGKGFMCYGDQVANVPNKLKKDDVPRLESLRQKKQPVAGEGSSVAHNKYYSSSDTASDATLYSSCSNKSEESTNETDDADESDMDLSNDNQPGDDDAASKENSISYNNSITKLTSSQSKEADVKGKKEYEEDQLQEGTFEKDVKAKVLTEIKKLLPTYFPDAIETYVKPHLNTSVLKVMKTNQINLFTQSSTSTDDLLEMNLKLNLLNQIHLNKSTDTHTTHQQLYDTLYESIILDQDTLDAQAAQSSFHKRSHDNQDPPNNRDGENKRRKDVVTVLSEAQWNNDERDVSKPRSFERHMSKSTKQHPCFYNSDYTYPVDLSTEEKYTTSITKHYVVRYYKEGIEDRIPKRWSKKVLRYYFDALTGIHHWGEDRTGFFKAEMSVVTEGNVYPDLRIKTVVRIIGKKKWGYSFLTSIVVRRSNDQEYKFRYADLPRLSVNDVTDIKRTVIKNMIKDIQLRSGKLSKNSQPHQTHNLSEVMKFCDGTLVKIQENLIDMMSKNKLGGGKKRHKEQLKWLEEYVGGRPKTVNPHTFANFQSQVTSRNQNPKKAEGDQCTVLGRRHSKFVVEQTDRWVGTSKELVIVYSGHANLFGSFEMTNREGKVGLLLGRDAIGKTGISALVKCTSAIRQLAYGAVPDSLDKYLQIGEKTSRDCLIAFCNGVMELYGEEFLRRTSKNSMLFHEKKHEFPGMICNIDCTKWSWAQCPIAHRAQFRSNNDVHVLRQSPVLNDHKVGKAPEISFMANDETYK